MGYILRRATETDAQGLSDCIAAAYASYVDQGIDLPAVSDGVADDIRDHTVLLAVEGNQILGGVILSAQTEVAKLMNIAVHPDQAGRGIGRALMEAATEAAYNTGHTRMRLATHVAMPQNVALYQHLGWVVTGEEGNKVVMERNLLSRPD